MRHKTKLMVLGAGPYQVALIQRAVQLGCYVITVDFLPDNLGHQYSHQYINCSTIDKEGVLEHALRLKIDGIMTMASDIAVPTVAYVADKLDLPGPSEKIAKIFTNKIKHHKFQVLHGLDHPVFDFATTPDKIDWARFNSNKEIIVKPPDTSGSRGVIRVKVNERSKREWAFEQAKSFSRTGQVCVEEFLDGIDVTGEGFLFDGNKPVIAFTEKYTRECVVLGHRLPGILNEHQQQLAIEAVLETFAVADYHTGPFDADLRVTEERAVVLEMSPRLGGNGCPLLFGAYTGMDLVEFTIRQTLGDRLQCPCLPPPTQGYGSVIIGSDCEGILESIKSLEKMCRALPFIRYGVWSSQIGDKIERFRHGGNALGFVIFESDSQDDYKDKALRVRNEADIQVRQRT